MDLHSGTPLWKIQNGVPCSFPRLTRDESCEVAIIGGGVTGALVAYSLADQGKNILWFEGRKIGQGSTLASTSLLSHAPDTHLADLTRHVGSSAAMRVYLGGMEAIDTLEAITRDLGIDCGFERRHSLYFASSEGDAAKLEEECRLRVSAGLPAEYWDAGQVRRRCAFAAPAAIWSDGEAQIDSYRLTLEIARRLSSLGAGIYENTCVRALQNAGDDITIDTLHGVRIRCKAVVLATGYESQEYLRTRPATLVSTFALASEPMPAISGWPEDCLMWETARPYLYLRRTHDGRVIVGGEDEPGGLTHTREAVIAAKCRTLRQRFGEMFPQVTLEPHCTWGGTFVDAPDGLPYIGTHEDFPGAWFALGYGGNGITFAVIAARIITTGLGGDSCPDASIYRFDRPAPRD